jgi:hypothetical protein
MLDPLGSKLLSEREVNQLARLLRDCVRRELPTLTQFDLRKAHHLVRIHPLSTRCREARERMGLSVKVAAAQAGAPQYRLKAIESGRQSEFNADVFVRYARLLAIEDWVSRWMELNPRLARDLGLVPFRSARGGRKGHQRSDPPLQSRRAVRAGISMAKTLPRRSRGG